MSDVPVATDGSRRRFLRDATLAGAALALPHAAAAAAAAAPIDAAIDRALAERRLVGTVVLVARDGRTVHRRAAGLADREAGTPMREDTPFRLASVSKPVVTTAAMALVAQGRLELDAPVTRWLPGFRPALADGSRPPISLRQLLSHTSGLGYRFLEADAAGPYARVGVSDGLDLPGFDLDENLRRLASVPLLFAPGSAWHYSLGVDVVGAAIERAADAPLADAVQRLVGAPLGWRDTAFHALDPARLAAVYVNDTPAPHRMQGPETVAFMPGSAGVTFDPARALDRSAYPSGGAGMVGTADELLRLLEALRQGGGDVLPAASVAEMARNQTGTMGPPDAPGSGFGLGFSVLRDPAAAASPEAPGSWRWGGAYGHAWFVDPVRRISVVALTNTLFEGMSGAFVGELRDAVYAQLVATGERA